MINYFSIQATGTGLCNCPPDFETMGVISPDSVSTSSKDEGASPATINLVDELISILAFNENG